MSDFGALDNVLIESNIQNLGILRITNRVYVRDDIGRFADHIENINRKSTEEALQAGTAAALEAAPKRTGELASTIHYRMIGPKVGEIVVGTDHWQYQEFGTPTHAITGRVSFWWEREGRRWIPGSNMIAHPGNRPQHFMERAYHVASEELEAAMRRNYGSLRHF